MGNLFVDPHGGDHTGFLDGACLARWPGVRDVAYILCNSIPRRVREAKEREWLQRYREILGAAEVTLTEDDAWQQYRLFAVYSWVAATSTAGTAAKWQPLHIGPAGTRRATEACQQLQSVELLDRASLLTRCTPAPRTQALQPLPIWPATRMSPGRSAETQLAQHWELAPLQHAPLPVLDSREGSPSDHAGVESFRAFAQSLVHVSTRSSIGVSSPRQKLK